MRLPSHEYTTALDTVTEAARLHHQEALLLRGMGAIFPEGVPTTLHTLLDVSCGAGSWALRIAHAYPGTKIIGLEANATLLGYAQAQQWARRLPNIQFLSWPTGKSTSLLAFPDASIDVISVQDALSSIHTHHLPFFFRECQRILRPGGRLRVAESVLRGPLELFPDEAPLHVLRLIDDACHRAGYCLALNEQAQLATLVDQLSAAGFTGIEQRLYALDRDTAMHQAIAEQFAVFTRLALPFLQAMGVVSEKNLTPLLSQAMETLRTQQLHAPWSVLLLWTHTPITAPHGGLA